MTKISVTAESFVKDGLMYEMLMTIHKVKKQDYVIIGFD